MYEVKSGTLCPAHKPGAVRVRLVVYIYELCCVLSSEYYPTTISGCEDLFFAQVDGGDIEKGRTKTCRLALVLLVTTSP